MCNAKCVISARIKKPAAAFYDMMPYISQGQITLIGSIDTGHETPRMPRLRLQTSRSNSSNILPLKMLTLKNCFKKHIGLKKCIIFAVNIIIKLWPTQNHIS